jgi:TfoX/Sxy family transcriptional regulator of competence genes
MAYDEATAKRVRSALFGQSNVVERKMMGGLKFMLNGNMLCSVSGRGGLLIRVGEKNREAVLKEPHVRPMKLGARTLAAFVLVDPAGYRTDAALRKWLQRGLDFLATLPVKAD